MGTIKTPEQLELEEYLAAVVGDVEMGDRDTFENALSFAGTRAGLSFDRRLRDMAYSVSGGYPIAVSVAFLLGLVKDLHFRVKHLEHLLGVRR